MKDEIEGIVGDATFDAIEKIVNVVANNNVVDGLPIAGLASGIYKMGKIIYEQSLIEKTQAFIEGLQSEQISKEKIEKYKSRIYSKDKSAQEEVKRVILIINRTIDTEKLKIFGKFYAACVNEEITWDKCFELSEALDKIFLSDIETIFELYKGVPNEKDTGIVKIYEPYRADRLIATGLLSNNSNGTTVRELAGGERTTFRKNEFGELFVQIAKR